MSEHSSIMGGSNAERRIMCPGSAIAEAGRPDTTSQAAEDGTRKHKLIERAMHNEIGVDDIDPEDREDIIEAARLFELFRDLTGLKFDSVYYEERVALDIPGVFGTIDVLARAGDVGVVLDWKFGHREVKAAHNIQLGTYAAGAISQLPAEFGPLKRWVFAIVQPAHGLSYWETDSLWIEHLREREREAANLIHAGEDIRRSGSWCDYCKGAIDCPELRSNLVQIGRFDKQPIPAVSYAEALALADKAEAFVKQVRAEANAAALERGETILGYKVVEKVARRKWSVSDKELLDALPEVATTVPLSPAQAEKKLGKAAYAERAAPLVMKESSGLVLVKDEDRRPAVDVSKQLSFGFMDALPDTGDVF